MAQIFDAANNDDYAIVELGAIDYFTLDISGTFDTASVTATICSDRSGTYHAFMPDGSAAAWDAATNVTLHYGSCQLKFTISAGDGSEAIDMWVNGANVLSTETTAA